MAMATTVDIIREFCLGLPEATEKLQWGDELCFKIQRKDFCDVGIGQSTALLQMHAGDLCRTDRARGHSSSALCRAVQVGDAGRAGCRGF